MIRDKIYEAVLVDEELGMMKETLNIASISTKVPTEATSANVPLLRRCFAMILNFTVNFTCMSLIGLNVSQNM